MKKILSLLAAGAMALGLIGCSGDLHDDAKVDPNAMIGYWSYRVIDTAGDDSINVITNNAGGQSGAYGSPDFAVDVSSGTAAILWDGKDSTDLMLSERTDCPSLTDVGVELSGDEACVFVFTPFSSVNLYCYAVDEGAFTSDEWPGVATTATVAVEKVKATITIKIVNGEADTKYWFSGLAWDAGWPYAGWNGNPVFATDDDHAKYRATTDAEGKATFSTPFESAEVDVGSTLKIGCKFVDIVDDQLEAGNPTYDSGDISINITNLTENKSFVATFDASAKTWTVE